MLLHIKIRKSINNKLTELINLTVNLSFSKLFYPILIHTIPKISFLAIKNYKITKENYFLQLVILIILTALIVMLNHFTGCHFPKYWH